jgi:pimeloyl-ACP methyl ester carboxylesterase
MTLCRGIFLFGNRQQAMRGKDGFMIRTIIMTIGIVALAYGVIVVAFYFLQGQLVYYPRKTIRETPDVVGLKYEDITYLTKDGVAINAWFVPAEPAKGTVIFCHGNAANISHRLDIFYIIHSLGYNVFMFDYRGYGNSAGGFPTEEGTYNDVQGAWDYLVKEKGFQPENIIVWGQSLGGAVAAWLSRHEKPRALILESTFTSTLDVGGEIYPFLPIRALCRFRYPTAEYVQAAQCPVLVIHSSQDRLIPYHHGKRLFELAPESKQFLDIMGDHNDGFIISGSKYSEGIKSFLDKYHKE